jgi:hypothetical protein
MIADMHRLERAARLSMGEFQDPDAAVLPARPSPRLFPRIGALALVALAATAAAMLLT